MQVFFYNKGVYRSPVEARQFGALYRTPSAINSLTTNTALQLKSIKDVVSTFCECAGLDEADWGICHVDGFEFKTIEGEYVCEVF